MKLIHSYIYILITLLFLLVFYYFNSKNESDLINCEGVYIKQTKNFSFSGILRFEFISKTEGMVIFSGKAFYDDNQSSMIFTKVNFEYKKSNENYDLISKNIVATKSDEKLSMKDGDFLIPNFFLEKNKKFQLGIYKVNKHGYMLYNIVTPFLYCHDKKL